MQQQQHVQGNETYGTVPSNQVSGAQPSTSREVPRPIQVSKYRATPEVPPPGTQHAERPDRGATEVAYVQSPPTHVVRDRAGHGRGGGATQEPAQMAANLAATPALARASAELATCFAKFYTTLADSCAGTASADAERTR